MGWLFVLIPILVLWFLIGIRIIRPTHRGLVESLGVPAVRAAGVQLGPARSSSKMYRVNITEVMVDAEPQEIITNDNLNARVDAQVYFKVKPDEESVKSSTYNVFNYQLPDREPRPDHPAQHHRHHDPEVGQQRAGQDQQRAAADPARGDGAAGASRSCARSSRRSTRPRTCRRP